MYDGGLIYAILHLTGFDLVDRLGDVHGDGAALGVGHEALGAQYAGDAANYAHHVRGSYANVEIKPVFGLDLLYQILVAYIISAGFLCFLGLVALGENQNANLLAGTVGQNHGSADLLVSVAGVYAQAGGYFDGLVKLCLGGGEYGLQTFPGIVQLLLIEGLYAILIFLSVLHFE